MHGGPLLSPLRKQAFSCNSLWWEQAGFWPHLAQGFLLVALGPYAVLGMQFGGRGGVSVHGLPKSCLHEREGG